MALPKLTPLQIENAIVVIAQNAVISEKVTGVPAEFTASQCIFESYYLTRCPQNNCFGIKADHHGTGAAYSLTEEYLNGKWVELPQLFETYATIADCFNDHARLLTQGAPYVPAWTQYKQDKDLIKFIMEVAKHYATDPHYGETMVKEATSPKIVAAINTARQRSAA